jgi:hypothetical protein
MAKATTVKAELEFSTRYLLVQDADGEVYLFNSAIVDSCRQRTTRAQKAQTKALFDTLRQENRLVDAAFLRTFHVFEGM